MTEKNKHWVEHIRGIRTFLPSDGNQERPHKPKTKNCWLFVRFLALEFLEICLFCRAGCFILSCRVDVHFVLINLDEKKVEGPRLSSGSLKRQPALTFPMDKTVAVSWWFWFGPGCRMVHCLAATQVRSETLNFSMSSVPPCQVLKS